MSDGNETTPTWVPNPQLPTIRAMEMIVEIDGSSFILRFFEERTTKPTEHLNVRADAKLEVARISMSQAGISLVRDNVARLIAVHEKIVGPLNTYEAARRKLDEAAKLDQLDKGMRGSPDEPPKV